MPRPLCQSCTHFTKPGQWSAPCGLIEWDNAKSTDWNFANRVRRADGSCPRYATVGVVEREMAL